MGEENEVELELKLIADVGLVGFPNAGKSTLVSALADVRVKTAPYPFTTMQPNLGYIQKEDYTRLWIADIPGIVENAHQNRGLGFQFLRHVERTRLLLFILDGSGLEGRTPLEDFLVLRREIGKYQRELLDRPFFVVVNKIDLDHSKDHLQHFYSRYPHDNDTVFALSALKKTGVGSLLSKLRSLSNGFFL